VIVAVAPPALRVAFSGVPRPTVKVSSGSGARSPAMGTERALAVSPGLKVRVPEAAV
jgi:hypothetical protein